MDLTDWELLTILFDKKNITKTSEKLLMSQPAITYRLKQIEETFNVKIVHRGRQGVVFTPEGEYLVEYAQEMLNKYQLVKEEVFNFDNKVQGVLRISASSIFSRYKLPQILGKFSEKYPDVEFHVNTGWSEDVINSVFRDNYHIGIVRGSYNFSHEKLLLMEESLFIVSKEPIEIKELSELPRIYYNTDTSLKKLIDKWWTENYESPSTITMKVDNMETCRHMVANGLGYAILPNILLEDDKELFKIPCLTQDGNFVKRQTWLVHKKEYVNNNLVSAFRNFLKDWGFGAGHILEG